MSQVLTAILALIQQVLPLLAGNQTAQVAAVVAGIIEALVQFTPLIKNEIGTLYTSVKGIITSLQGVTSDTDQLAALQSLDAQVDAAWAAVEQKLDPDATQGTTAS